MIAPRAPGLVSFGEAQGMVNAIWSEMGLKYPPAVEPLPKQARATVVSASRMAIYLPERTPSWCLLHEVSHAMTSTFDGHSDGHGKLFVGIYIRLIVRYLQMDLAQLMLSINDEGIESSSTVQPAFLGALSSESH